MDPLLSALVEAGVLPLGDAERVERELDPEAMRLHAEALLTDAFERGLTAQQRRLLAVVEQAQGQPTPRNLERLWAQENELLWASVRDDLTSVAIDRAVGASIGAADPDTWQMVNEEVVNWVDTRYLRDDPDEVGSIPNLNRTSREMFATAFQRWQLGDRDPDNFAGGLPQLIAELQPIFGRTRAERIAVTETTRVFAQSEIFAGNANPFIEAWLYETAADDRVTPVCRSGQGRIMRKGESVFSDGMGPPPRHVRCRSSITQLTGPALAALIEDGDISGDNLPDVTELRPRAAVAVTPSRPQTPVFKTTQEAQEWAAHNISSGKVSYRGVDADVANVINQVSDEILGDNPKIPKWSGIVAKAEKNDSYAATQLFTNDLRINTTTMGSRRKFEATQQRAREADAYVRNQYHTITDPKLRQRAARALQFNRSLVGDSLEDMVTHEIGHHIDFTVLMKEKELRQSIIDRRAAYVLPLSSYADANAFEFIAESFVAYRKGERSALMPELVTFFEGLGL